MSQNLKKTEREKLVDDFQSQIDSNPSPEQIQILVKGLFDKWLSIGQAKIVKKIVFGGQKIGILAPTRYGKSVAIGVAIALYLVINGGKNVTIMANKKDTTETIRTEFINAAVNSPRLMELLEGRSTDAKKLSEEVSKNKLQLKDGTKVIIQTAGTNVKPDALDGIGGDLNILDESDNVPDENFTKGIRRMQGESENAKLVQTGNATMRNKHFKNCWESDEYETFKITWRDAINHTYGPNGEKCLTKDFIMAEKAALPPSHFQAMYECEFPENADDSLIPYKYLNKCRKQDLPREELSDDPTILYGLDLAREGRDYSCLTRVEKHGGFYLVTDQILWDIPDIQRVSEKAMEKIDEWDGDDYTRVNVDTHGMGSGALDILRRNGYYATGVKVGVSKRKALKRPDDFQDLKAEFYDKLRRIFTDGDIYFTEDQPQLVNELSDIESERNTRNKIRVVDPKKSPDRADSLMLAISVDRPRKTSDTGKTKAF